MSENAMRLLVNGELKEYEGQPYLVNLLQERGIPAQGEPGIAVALNDRVVRSSDWDNTAIEEGDRIEIVSARQGG